MPRLITELEYDEDEGRNLGPSLDMLNLQYQLYLLTDDYRNRESANRWLKLCVDDGATCDMIEKALTTSLGVGYDV